MTYLGQDKLLTQTVPCIIKPVVVRFNCAFSPNLESLTTSKLTDFSVFQKNTPKKNIRQNIIQANYSYYNVDIMPHKIMKIFLKNVGGKRI